MAEILIKGMEMLPEGFAYEVKIKGNGDVVDSRTGVVMGKAIEVPSHGDWHTGAPTEFGWYVYEASSGGCYFTYIVDNEASLHFLANTNFVRRWQKIEPYVASKGERNE